jgi:hypothetical protein
MDAAPKQRVSEEPAEDIADLALCGLSVPSR